ncbi:MAG: Major facilitator superfamily 1 [Candidatus Saccharibacteria bacterium]|nr:Major facilitator superfamily 1 [Candidatus Saccharibacteria bacterium]
MLKTNTKIRYLLITNYLQLFAFSFFNPLFALYVLHLGAKPEIIGVAWGVNMYAAALTILLFGRYENQNSNKERLVVLGYFVLAAGAASFLLVSNVWQLLVVQIVNAVGLGMMTPAWRTAYAQSEDKGKEIMEWSLVDGGGRFFIATGAMVGSLIYKYFGFHGIFILIALVQLIAAVISLQLLKPPAVLHKEPIPLGPL